MCGFAGGFGAGAADEDALRRMASSMRHRGPDDSGVWCDARGGIGFAHARLSILDLSPAGHQPMQSASGRHTLAYNGEIYNHMEMRAELDASGERTTWRGHSDTETLLACFAAWGVEPTLRRAVGMFAFALWDADRRTLTLARDRFGEKPLYYGWQKGTLLFGSELKALKAHPAFSAEIDLDSLAAFMRFGYVPAPHSIYRGIQKLTPGTSLTLRAGDDGGVRPVAYWSLLDVARDGMRAPLGGSDAEVADGLEGRLCEAVSLQQISDVPVGAFLSGGIDSSTIVAIMQARSTRPVHTFTIGFEGRQYDEAGYARAVARHLGTDHTEHYVTPDEARSVIPRLPVLYDEPFADSSQIPTFLVSQLARRNVTVSLSGDAGDELFGGYNRYTWASRLLRVPPGVRRALGARINALSPNRWDQVYSGVSRILPQSVRVRAAGDKAHKLSQFLAVSSDSSLYERMVSIWPEPGEVVPGGNDPAKLDEMWKSLADFESAESRMMALDTLTYLPDDILCKVDRAAMGVSLETRVPFLDHRVVEYAWRVPLDMKIRSGQGKWILRQVLDRYVPRTLIERPKMGFGVPIDAWLRGPLREWAEELLSAERLEHEGYLRPEPIRRKWAEHISGSRNWQHQLWSVLMFQAWLEAP